MMGTTFGYEPETYELLSTIALDWSVLRGDVLGRVLPPKADAQPGYIRRLVVTRIRRSRQVTKIVTANRLPGLNDVAPGYA